MSIGVPTINAMLDIALGAGPLWFVPTDSSNTEIAARQAISYGAAVGGVKTSTSSHLFEMTIATNVTKFRLFDAVTAGNFIWDGPLNRPAPAGVGDRISIGIGAITHTIT